MHLRLYVKSDFAPISTGLTDARQMFV